MLCAAYAGKMNSNGEFALIANFVSLYASLSYAVMRMTRIALYEPFVSLGSGVLTRSGGYPTLRRDTPAA